MVVITDFLTDEQMNDLFRATTYYVNASRAEGACLPLQQALPPDARPWRRGIRR